MRHDIPRFETARAKVGAKLLDLIHPGWANKVTPEKLNLADCKACVLGQLFGDYDAGAEQLFAIRSLRTASDGTTYHSSTERIQACGEAGFTVPLRAHIDVPDYQGTMPYFANLTKAWKREIAKRTKAQPAAA